MTLSCTGAEPTRTWRSWLSTDGEEVPVVIPLPLAEQPVKAPATDAVAAPEQGGRIAAADLGLADVHNASNGASPVQPGAQGGTLNGAAAGPPLPADAASATAPVRAPAGTAVPAEAAPTPASQPSTTASQPAGSNGTSAAAASEPSGNVDSEVTGDQSTSEPALQATAQPSPAPADVALRAPSASIPADLDRPSRARTSAPPATEASPAPVLLVEPAPADSPSVPSRPAAVAAPDAAPAKAPARPELGFAELAVGSGRSGGGIYDVLVQARPIGMLPMCVPSPLWKSQEHMKRIR